MLPMEQVERIDDYQAVVGQRCDMNRWLKPGTTSRRDSGRRGQRRGGGGERVCAVGPEGVGKCLIGSAPVAT